MQVGIDSFAAAYTETSLSAAAPERLGELVEQIVQADQVGLDVFGIGEHHRRGVPGLGARLSSLPPRRRERSAFG